MDTVHEVSALPEMPGFGPDSAAMIFAESPELPIELAERTRVYQQVLCGALLRRSPADVLSPEIVGFRRIVDSQNADITWYQKVTDVPNLDRLLAVDQELRDIDTVRTSVEGADHDLFLQTVRFKLQAVRWLYDHLGPEQKQQLLLFLEQYLMTVTPEQVNRVASASSADSTLAFLYVVAKLARQVFAEKKAEPLQRTKSYRIPVTFVTTPDELENDPAASKA